MASKWNGKPCHLCGTGTLHDGVKTVVQKYKGHTFSSETRGAFCDHCADGFVEFDAAEETAWLAFRDQVDTVEAAELIRIRKKLKLTQAEAARLAGGGGDQSVPPAGSSPGTALRAKNWIRRKIAVPARRTGWLRRVVTHFSIHCLTWPERACWRAAPLERRL